MPTSQYAAKVSIGGALSPSFGASFSGASKAIGKLGKEVQSLAAKRSLLKSFGDSSSRVDKLKNSLGQAQVKLAAAKTAFAGADKTTEEFANAVNEANNQVKKLDASLKKEIGTLGQLDAKMKSARLGTSNIDGQRSKLGSLISSKIARGDRFNAAKQNFSAARGQVGSSVTTALAIGAMGAAFVPAIKSAGQFETKLFEIKRTGELTEAQIGQVASAVAANSNRQSTNRSQTQLLDSAGQLVAMGADVGTIGDSIRSIGRASVATGAEMSELTKVAFTFQQQMGILGKDSEAAFGIIATGSKKGEFEIKDMAKALPSVLSKAASIGMQGSGGLASTVAALEIARKGVGSNDEAANNVENLLAKLTSPATVGKFAKNFDVDWIKEFEDAKKKGLDPLIFSLDRIQQVTKGNSFKLGNLFEDMQVKAALIPLLKFRKQFEEIRKQALDGKGLIGKDFETSLNTWPELIATFFNSIEKLNTQIGKELLGAVTKIIIGLSKAVEKIQNWQSKNPKLFSQLVQGTAITLALGLVVSVLGVAVATASFAFSGLATIFAGLAMITLPAVAAFAAVAAAIGAAALVVLAYWEPIKTFFLGVWEGIVSGWNEAGGPALFEQLKVVFNEAKIGLLAFLEPVKFSPDALQKVFEAGKILGNFLGVTFVGLLSMALSSIETFKAAISSLGDAFSFIFSGMRAAAESSLGFIATRLEEVSGMINAAMESLGGLIGGGIKAVVPKGAAAVPPSGETSMNIPQMRGAMAANGPININVQASPGQSEEGIAQSVMRRIKAAQDASNRGALYDAAMA